MNKFFNPSLAITLIFLLIMATAILTDGKIDYKDIANTAISGYIGYIRGKQDE